jgi:hypothetical protein
VLLYSFRLFEDDVLIVYEDDVYYREENIFRGLMTCPKAHVFMHFLLISVFKFLFHNIIYEVLFYVLIC